MTDLTSREIRLSAQDCPPQANLLEGAETTLCCFRRSMPVAAQAALHHRAKCNGHAAQGKHSGQVERETPVR
jgi:hypothetical protein